MKGSSARKNKQTNKLCSGSLNTSVYLCYSAKLPPGWVKSTVYVETTEQNKSQYTHLLSYIKNDMLIISFVRMYKKTTILQSRDGYFHKALNIDRKTESCGWRKKKVNDVLYIITRWKGRCEMWFGLLYGMDQQQEDVMKVPSEH